MSYLLLNNIVKSVWNLPRSCLCIISSNNEGLMCIKTGLSWRGYRGRRRSFSLIDLSTARAKPVERKPRQPICSKKDKNFIGMKLNSCYTKR